MAPRRGGPGHHGRRPAARLFAHDRSFGVRRVAGADEAGRGCLAGPLVVAAVCLDLEGARAARGRRALGDLDDSKRLAPDVRERVAEAIMRHAEQVVVLVASPATIDRDGLHSTNLRLLARALAAIAALPGGLPGGRLPPRTRGSAAPGGRGGRPSQRVHRRRLGDRQDHAGPPHGRPDGGGLSRASASTSTSATRRPSTTPRCGPGAVAAAPALLPVGGLPRSTGGQRWHGHGSPTAPGRWRTRARKRPRRTARRSRRTVRPASSGRVAR